MANEHLTQFCTAWALARAYDHGWATEIPFLEIVLAVEHASTPEEACEAIKELYDRFYYSEFPTVAGIECPALDASGNIVHETTTGRMTWTVWPDGAVTFLVSTPYGVVAQADVSAPEVAWTHREDVPYVRRSVNMWARNARPRHIMALSRAVGVLETVPGHPNGDVLEMARYLQHDPFVLRDMPGIRSLHIEVDLDGSYSISGPGVHFMGSWPCAAAGIFVPLFAPFTLRDLAREFAYLSSIDPEYTPIAIELGLEEHEVEYYSSAYKRASGPVSFR